MSQNLVIVESPSKIKSVGKFLGKDFTVMSSYGHIRDLKPRSFSLDEHTFEPEYEVPADKSHLVAQLRAAVRKSDIVWLASDEDREGEAIAWHLQEVLHLTPEKTRRIVFHEITKPALLEAIEHPRTVDLSLVYAQQARRVLDRIVGFKLSPILWRKVKPALSAGRVQSVTLRLLVEREREVANFKAEAWYRITALLTTPKGEQVKAELNKRYATREEAEAFLKGMAAAKLTIEDVQTRPTRRTPSAPFTTSTLQQEAAHKLGFTVAQTMAVAQRLYEAGYITYMRTDSVNLSTLCLGACRKVITETMGAAYVNIHQYHTQTKGAQEAHEAIRPTYMDTPSLKGVTLMEARLYELIWKRTIACQMADAQLEKTTATIGIEGREEQFVASGEVCKFDGFLRVYRDSSATADDEAATTETGAMLPTLAVGETLLYAEMQATERFTQRPPRYTEATLVRKMEELGFGRPSTYAPTISTIQQRDYVIKGDKEGDEHIANILTLKDGKVTSERTTVVLSAEHGKLLPTDIGIVTTDFLMATFPRILDYNFTADVEKQFDDIAHGEAKWRDMIQAFWKVFEPSVEKALNDHTELRAGERVLGVEPTSGKPVSVKIGRYGPIVQIGATEDTEKPRFAQLKKGQTLETLTLEEALELFKLPRTLGAYEGEDIVVGTGRYGNYIYYKKRYITLPATLDPLTMTLEDALELIRKQQQREQERHIKKFDNVPDLEIMNGCYGPYVCYQGVNYRLSKAQQAMAKDLTVVDCLNVVNAHKK